ncbi:MAG: HAD family hydrolase [Alphaproteobacteria bacterium]|nr:HAD family hydrolase [Alphaproteobacteria bacterium]
MRVTRTLTAEVRAMIHSSPQLSWLPSPDPNWPASLEGLTGHALWQAVMRAANTQLDMVGTLKLDREARRRLPTPPDGPHVRLAILASSTVEHLLPALRVAGLRRGLWLECHVGDYGQYRAELSDPASRLRTFRPTAILFALDARHLLGTGAASVDSDSICNDISGLWRMARAFCDGPIIQQTVLPVFPRLLGNNEHRFVASRAATVEAVNARLRQLADSESVDILALDVLTAQHGIAAWHHPAFWHRAKQEIHPAAAPLYADHAVRIVTARLGRSAKCLVLDLDNTLWGGVIGDDGLGGIVLGQGSALGEAFVDFQVYAQSLSRRGIILAVCSKNDEKNAVEPFEAHPEMILKRGDIACFVANWSDKASNLRTIAKALNIGIDSLVFADDNPAERAIVRRELPEVAVPELPEDPARYASTIADAGYFEAATVTTEDLQRSAQYQANLDRERTKASTTDIEGYLRSLEMRLMWRRFDRTGLARITQLTNKTNQFNLTTRRVTEADVEARIDDPRSLTLQLRLTDKFGDNGIIALVYGRYDPDERAVHLDNWLMSCRVLGRQVEEATLNLIAEQARQMGSVELRGTYIPSAKNDMVREHYARLGFELTDTTAAGETNWRLSISDFEPRHTHIQILQA